MFSFSRKPSGPSPIREERFLVSLGEQSLDCLLRRSPRRRSLAVRVSDAGEVVVNAPQRLGVVDIHGFLQKHADWISARLLAVRAHRFEWCDGALLPYLGGQLQLRLLDLPGPARVRREGDCLLCNAQQDLAPTQVTRWYQRSARVLFGERLAHHAARAGCALPPLRLSNARGRWGSLSPKGVVSLNWRLLKAGPEQLDYVICHELAHFSQRNHSPAFWREVALLFPEWKRVRGELRLNGHLYFQF